MQKQITRVLMLLVVLVSFSSCSVIGDIFKAGMGVGIFLVVAILLIVFFIIRKVFNRK